MRKVNPQTSSTVKEVEDTIEKITIVVKETTMVIEAKVKKKAKIKNEKRDYYICKRTNHAVKDCYHRCDRCPL